MKDSSEAAYSACLQKTWGRWLEGEEEAAVGMVGLAVDLEDRAGEPETKAKALETRLVRPGSPTKEIGGPAPAFGCCAKL